MRSIALLTLATACTLDVPRTDEDDGDAVETLAASAWADFPSDRDLAVLFPLQEVAVVPADTRLQSGDAALPQAWVDAVSDAYGPTIVADGFGEESWYEDWRLVSMRVSPCAPIARSPALAPASVCWPVVRLVWQPVVGFMDRGGVQIDAWADDRAIHAIYPVQPRDPAGRRVDALPLERVQGALDAGTRYADLSSAEQAAFEDSRDRTTTWLLDTVATLRDADLPVGSWDGIDDRPELTGSAPQRSAFAARLTGFLSQTATAGDLRELTAFSLPAGRQPSGDDAWVFVQFTSDGRDLRRKSLEVYSRRDGDLLLDYGLDQDAGQTRESPAVEAALDADPSGELHDTVVASSTDIDEIADLIADPSQVFVPNTTCASCHRLNGLRFDFHSLSHFEDNAHTVSPRVEADVARDRAWTDAWLAGSAWSEDPDLPATDDDEQDDPSTDTGETEDPEEEDLEPQWEPNDTVAEAIPLRLPVDQDLEITAGDQDIFAIDLEGERRVTVTLTFSNDVGDLDLALADADGVGFDYSATTDDRESLTATLPAGRTLVWVYGFEGATGPYTLRVE